jgi:hypothetical protein
MDAAYCPSAPTYVVVGLPMLRSNRLSGTVAATPRRTVAAPKTPGRQAPAATPKPAAAIGTGRPLRLNARCTCLKLPSSYLLLTRARLVVLLP